MSNKVSENQHYVPQFLLRNFQNAKGSLNVFDKHSNNIFEVSTRNIAAERNFNEFNFNGHTLTLEPSLCELEKRVSKIVNEIIDRKSLCGLTLDKKKYLSHFILVQHMRTRGQVEIIKDFSENLSKKLIEMGVEPNEAKVDEVNDEQLFVKNILNAHQLIPHLLSKAWVLLETTRESQYFISDNPVVLQNQNQMPGRGNLGFAVEGIEIYLPLTRALTLGLWCSSHMKAIEEGHENAKAILQKIKIDRKMGLSSDRKDEKVKKKLAVNVLRRVKKPLKAFKTGKPLKALPENVTNLNSLQVIFSERFVMGPKNDFELVKDMIAENKESQKGQRFSFD